MVTWANTTVQVTLNLRDVARLPIPMPPEKERIRITRILGALDDKIDLNRRMNATLEATARALFQSWFVDFDPVRAKAEGRQPEGMDSETAALFPDAFEDSALGLIPKGWRVEPLDKIAEYQNGLALQKFPPEGDEFLPVIKIRELRQGYVDENSDKASPNIKEACIVYDGDVLFSWSGSLLVDVWCGGMGALNQHLFKVTSTEYPKWFYLHWTQHHLEEFIGVAADKATTMGHIQRQHLSSALTVVPPGDTLAQLDVFISPLVEQMIQVRLESRTLAETRDALLPKLLSGEMRVGSL
jgi:type I restriction enzyme S subunit